MVSVDGSLTLLESSCYDSLMAGNLYYRYSNNSVKVIPSNSYPVKIPKLYNSNLKQTTILPLLSSSEGKMKSKLFQYHPIEAEYMYMLNFCSLASQGLLYRLMHIMQRSPRFGYLVIGDKSLDAVDIAKLLKLRNSRVVNLLQELESNQLLQKSSDNLWFSPFLVRAEKYRERARKTGFLSLKNPKVPRPKNDQARTRLGQVIRTEVQNLPLPVWFSRDLWRRYIDYCDSHFASMGISVGKHAIKLYDEKYQDGYNMPQMIEDAITENWPSVMDKKKLKHYRFVIDTR